MWNLGPAYFTPKPHFMTGNSEIWITSLVLSSLISICFYIPRNKENIQRCRLENNNLFSSIPRNFRLKLIERKDLQGNCISLMESNGAYKLWQRNFMHQFRTIFQDNLSIVASPDNDAKYFRLSRNLLELGTRSAQRWFKIIYPTFFSSNIRGFFIFSSSLT